MSATPTVRTIQRLRSEIETIDRSIVLLLGARERAQHRLLAWKETSGIPGIDPIQEATVFSRAATWARESGTDERLASGVIRLALESGKRSYFQGRGAARTVARPMLAPSPKTRIPSRAVRRVNSG
jgi:chorismate mutase